MHQRLLTQGGRPVVDENMSGPTVVRVGKLARRLQRVPLLKIEQRMNIMIHRPFGPRTGGMPSAAAAVIVVVVIVVAGGLTVAGVPLAGVAAVLATAGVLGVDLVGRLNASPRQTL
jgi:hypothetical protein